jgi:hypothetical protein
MSSPVVGCTPSSLISSLFGRYSAVENGVIIGVGYAAIRGWVILTTNKYEGL